MWFELTMANVNMGADVLQHHSWLRKGKKRDVSQFKHEEGGEGAHQMAIVTLQNSRVNLINSTAFSSQLT